MNPQLGEITQGFMRLLIWLIVARAIVSMFPIRPHSPFFQLKQTIIQVTEPVVAPFRRFVPSSRLMDFTPMAAIVAIILTQAVLMSLTSPA